MNRRPLHRKPASTPELEPAAPLAARPFPSADTQAAPQGHTFAQTAVHGEHAVVQTKPTASQSEDQYEQETERVAVSVLRQSGASAGGDPPPNTQAAHGSGVDTHTGQLADTLHRALNVRAFTTRQAERQSDSRASQLQSATTPQPIQAKLMDGAAGEYDEQLSESAAQPDAQTHQLNKTIQAKAFTTGQHGGLVQRVEEPAAQRPNRTGLPDALKSGVEDLSGVSLDNVKVHYNSSQPAQLHALAYAQGSDIHVAPGQEQHLPHEAWHVVQQAQGRVRPTTRTDDGVSVNDDKGLEHDADVMGGRALIRSASGHRPGHDRASTAQQESAVVQRTVVQRRNGAVPQNFRVTNTALNNADCSVRTDLAWDSSTGNLADLADFQSREEVTFNADPRVNMPAYAGHLSPGMVLNGNVLTKPVGAMSNPGGVDNHSGAGNGTKFTVGGLPNLRRAAWVLVGTQYYQTKQDGGVWVNAAGPFTITRTMVQNGNDFTLSISKIGPGCAVAAGPTPITLETSTAMARVGADRVDQTAEWNTARATLANAGPNKPVLNFNAIATDVRNNAHGVPITVDYEYTSSADVNHAFAQAYHIPPAWRTLIYQKARSAARGMIDNVLTGAAPPTRFIITIFRCSGVQQQAMWTNENGGTYRVLLRADKLMDMAQWGGDVNTSMAGRESQRNITDKGKKGAFTKAVVTHELGHMLHGVSNSNMYLTATMMPANIQAIRDADPPDPLAAEKIHICEVNGRVINALNGQNLKQKWGYALNNPGEVVPEVFTAIQHRQNVPRALALVYVAYGGMRGGNVDAALRRSLGGVIPPINEPEDVIALI